MIELEGRRGSQRFGLSIRTQGVPLAWITPLARRIRETAARAHHLIGAGAPG